MGAPQEMAAESQRPNVYQGDADAGPVADVSGGADLGVDLNEPSAPFAGATGALGQADEDARLPGEADSMLGESAELQMLESVDGLIQLLAVDGDASRSDRLSRFLDGLGAVADVAAELEVPSLVDVCAALADRLSQIDGEGADEEATTELLAQFPLLLMDYLAAPSEAADALLEFLRHPHWRVAMSDDELGLLRLSLSPAPDAAEAEDTARPATAEHETAAHLDDSYSLEASVAAQALIAPDASEINDAAATSFAPQCTSAEMLAFAASELERNYAALEEALVLGADADGDDARHAAWTGIDGELSHLAAGSEAIGLGALAQFLGWIQEQGALLVQSGHLTNASLAALATLPDALRGYFADPQDPERAQGLTGVLHDLGGDRSRFPGLDQLAAYLSAVELTATEPDVADARPVVADLEAVSLALPEDLNPELLEGLLTELPIQTAAFTESMQKIVSGQGGGSDIETAKRAAHTLKGAANTVGVKGIANLSHHLEDLLIGLSAHGLLPNMGLAQTLGYAADCLEAMSEALMGAGEPPADAVDVLQDVLNWANRIDAQGIGVAGAVEPIAIPGQRISSSVEETRDSASDQVAESEQTRSDSAAQMLRVPTSLVDEQLRLVGETMTSTAQIQNRLRLATRQAMAASQQNLLLRQLIDDLVDLVDLRGVDLPLTQAVDTGFDALELDQYGELHTLTRRLVEVTTDASEMGRGTEEHLVALRDLVEMQSRLQLASQHAVMRARMVSVTSVVSRLQRAVRQACRLLDKDVHLALQGTDTLVDGSILNALVDGLMHLLRNAVDHGIESAEERLASGKDPVGLIQVSFKREGDSVIMICRDDGRGLELEEIRQAAVRKGLIAATDVLSQDQLTRLVLTSGFSTRGEATQVSGRGIGLDAVDAMVQELKGAMSLQTEPGRGLTVEIRLPTTLLSAQVLLARVRGRTIALATRGVEEIHFVTLDQLQPLGDRLAFQYGEQLHDVMRLEELLQLDGVEKTAERVGYPLLRVRMSNGAYASVLVDEVAESRNLVVKKLGVYVGRIDGVIGATILGDGSVAPVVDLPDLLRIGSGQPARAGASAARRIEASAGASAERQTPTRLHKVLVVDDSISARRTTAQVFKDAGFEVQTAIDGLEAAATLEEGVPDIVITDMEMPRMNGLEFAAHIRSHAALQHLPIVMITSRSTDRHRQQALSKGVDVYLVKPFSPEQLIAQVGALMGGRA